MNVSYKNYLFHLTGCTLSLFVGARTQSVKAIYLEPCVVEEDWKRNPKVFQKTFDALFRQAESPHLWSEKFLGRFKVRNRDLYTVKTSSSSNVLSFHTLDDLEKLSCDDDLKKVIRIVGSTEFLEKVLLGVAGDIVGYATHSKYLETKITFEQGLEKGFFNELGFFNEFGKGEKGFFNEFGKGTLRMKIEQFPEKSELLPLGLAYGLELKKEDSFMVSKVSKGLSCTFYFVFEKKDDLTVLTGCEASYALSSGGARMKFVKKTEKISDFQWDVGTVKKAQENFPSVYAKLKDQKMKDQNRKFKISLDAKAGLKQSYRKSWEAAKPLLKVLITEDFLEGIFGETFWNILKYYGWGKPRGELLSVDFDVSKCGEGYKVSCKFRNKHRGNMERDVTAFSNKPPNWEWLDFIYIHFVFFYDPQKDEISNVRLQDKLVLNYELISKSDKSGGLIAMDNEDSSNPFEKIQEQYEEMQKQHDASNRSDDEDSDPEDATSKTDPNGCYP